MTIIIQTIIDWTTSNDGSITKPSSFVNVFSLDMVVHPLVAIRKSFYNG